MFKITNKQDVEKLIEQFTTIASWDGAGKKWYIACEDKDCAGTLTLMYYAESHYTFHRKNATFCDEGETVVTKQQVADLIWKHRAAVNRALKSLVAV